MQKLDEIKSVVGTQFPYEIENICLDLPELQGDIDDISIKKCQEAACRLNQPVLIEDSCLGFSALNGLPGPYIKWFLHRLGPEGVYKLLHGWDDKSAEAISTFAYCEGECSDDEVVLFKGATRGHIVKPRGDPCPGRWDCIFQPEGYSQTYGEMSLDMKQHVSQSFKAALELKKYFQDRYDRINTPDPTNSQDSFIKW